MAPKFDLFIVSVNGFDFMFIFEFVLRVRLIDLKRSREHLFATLWWVNKDENMQTNKFPQPMGQFISHSY